MGGGGVDMAKLSNEMSNLCDNYLLLRFYIHLVQTPHTHTVDTADAYVVHTLNTHSTHTHSTHTHSTHTHSTHTTHTVHTTHSTHTTHITYTTHSTHHT